MKYWKRAATYTVIAAAAIEASILTFPSAFYIACAIVIICVTAYGMFRIDVHTDRKLEEAREKVQRIRESIAEVEALKTELEKIKAISDILELVPAEDKKQIERELLPNEIPDPRRN